MLTRFWKCELSRMYISGDGYHSAEIGLKAINTLENYVLSSLGMVLIFIQLFFFFCTVWTVLLNDTFRGY